MKTFRVITLFLDKMEYLPYFLKEYNVDLRPKNSVTIDSASAKTVLYPGAHIAVSNPFEHYHHGIVVDVNTPDISIIHLWGQDKVHNRVQTTTLPIFIAGSIQDLGKRVRQLYLINYDNDTLEKQQETVRVAKETLAKADDVKYDIATTNCESFAYFCRTGEWTSYQIKTLTDVLVEKAPEIYKKVENGDEHTKKTIASLLKTVPKDALNPSEKALFDEFCHEYLGDLNEAQNN
jgi:hypothetical protein